jgi:hypothetical protein
MAMSSEQADLKREVADELTLAESSHVEDTMREPIQHWLPDPTEVPRYIAVQRGLLGARLKPWTTLTPGTRERDGTLTGPPEHRGCSWRVKSIGSPHTPRRGSPFGLPDRDR